MMKNNEQLWDFATRWLTAWSSGKPEELIKFYAPSAYYSDPAYPNGLNDPYELLSYFQKLLTKYHNWIWHPVELFPIGKGFILKWKMHYNNSTTRGLDIVEIDDGLITRNEVYFNPKNLQ